MEKTIRTKVNDHSELMKTNIQTHICLINVFIHVIIFHLVEYGIVQCCTVAIVFAVNVVVTGSPSSRDSAGRAGTFVNVVSTGNR